MTLESSYARALFEVASKKDAKSDEILKNLRQSLKARGHEKLLPKIYGEYEKLEIKNARLEEHKKITPEAERTRILLELYRRLIATPAH